MSEQSKRVLVITHAGGSPYHGPNMRWYHLANALRDQSIEVEIVSSSFFHKYFAPPSVSSKLTHETVDNIQYHWIRAVHYSSGIFKRFINQLQFAYGCFLQAESLKDAGFDYVVASSPHPLVVFPARRIAKLSGAKLIFEIRDLWPLILNESTGMSLYHPYAKLMSFAENYGVKRSELVISVKPGDFEYLSSTYKLEKRRFRYIPNGFLPGNRSDKPSKEAERLCHGKNFVIGYIGALSSIYEIGNLIETARRFRNEPDVAFIIAGQGNQEDEFRSMAEDLNNVYFLGHVPNTSVPAMLRMFDACYVGLKTMPMNRYGISSNKIYEYMHASKPIIGCYKVGYDPLIDASCGLISNPGDIDSLEASVRLLMNDVELAKKMGRNARAYFDKHHHFKAVGKKLATEVFV